MENLTFLRDDGAQDETGLMKVITEVTHNVGYHSVSANGAIQWAVDALAGEGGEIRISRGKYILNEAVKLGNNHSKLLCKVDRKFNYRCNWRIQSGLIQYKGTHGLYQI